MSSSSSSPTRAGIGVFILYAIGQFGWSLVSYGVLNLLPYFYLPPETETSSVFPTFIFQGPLLGVLTLIGLIGFGGRIVDACTDPWIANWSDNSGSKMGRRRPFMLASALPFALLSAAAFFPPSAEAGGLNTIWLIVTVILFYIAMTIYVIPYTALIPELAKTQKDRLNISTAISVAWASGFAIGAQIYGFQAGFEEFMSSTQAFQRVILIYAGIGFLCMMLSAWFLNERKYAGTVESNMPLRKSLSTVLGNHNFRLFAASDFFYWLALTFIQLGISYYVINLTGRDKEYVSFFLLMLFLISFLGYVPILAIGRILGKRKTLLGAFLLLLLTFALTSVLGMDMLPEEIHLWLIIGLSAVALSAFGILPNAVIGDLADQHSKQTGQRVEGMYYGVRTFVMKAGISVANLVFPSFLLLSGDFGIRLSALAALCFCLLGFIFLIPFREAQES